MYISPPLQKTDESSAIQHCVKVSANVQACMRVCVCGCDSALAPLCFHWFRRELNSVYVNEVAFKHMPWTIILKQVFSCTKTRPCSEWVKYLATNIKPSWGDRGEMSQLVCHLACQFAHGCKHDTQESLCTFNDDHNNKWYRLSIKELPGDDQAGNIILTFMKFDKCQNRKRLVKSECKIKRCLRCKAAVELMSLQKSYFRVKALNAAVTHIHKV